MENWFRHGEVIINKIDLFPKDIKLKKVKDVILAKGEVTGHFHKLKDELLFAKSGDIQYLELDNELELEHQEHDTLQIPKGKYEVLIQREVDLLGEVRQVMD